MHITLYLGSIPFLYLDNNPIYAVYEGTNVTLTAEWSSNLPVDVAWLRHYDKHLPHNSHIDVMSIGDKNYSSLIIPNVTNKGMYDDRGMYIFRATNKCGTSSANTTLLIESSKETQCIKTFIKVAIL